MQQLERQSKIGPGNRAAETGICVGEPSHCVSPFRLELGFHGFDDALKRGWRLPVRECALEPRPMLILKLEEQFRQPARFRDGMKAKGLLEIVGEFTGVSTGEFSVLLQHYTHWLDFACRLLAVARG